MIVLCFVCSFTLILCNFHMMLLGVCFSLAFPCISLLSLLYRFDSVPRCCRHRCALTTRHHWPTALISISGPFHAYRYFRNCNWRSFFSLSRSLSAVLPPLEQFKFGLSWIFPLVWPQMTWRERARHRPMRTAETRAADTRNGNYSLKIENACFFSLGCARILNHYRTTKKSAMAKFGPRFLLELEIHAWICVASEFGAPVFLRSKINADAIPIESFFAALMSVSTSFSRLFSPPAPSVAPDWVKAI